MREKYKFFVFSDIHGHYTQLIEALDTAGYDRDNESHIIVGCGDYFDRGRENKKVYDFLCSVERKVLVRGNHDDMLLDVIENGRYNFTHVHNGTDLTLEEFFGSENVRGDGTLAADRETSERLMAFLRGMRNYYETDRYVFVHGWIPVIAHGGIREPLPLWRQAADLTWSHARYLCWNEEYRAGSTLRAKTIVCGHRSVSYAAEFEKDRASGDSSPFYGDGVIAVDALTIRSGRVNVVVIEDRTESIPWIKKSGGGNK